MTYSERDRNFFKGLGINLDRPVFLFQPSEAEQSKPDFSWKRLIFVSGPYQATTEWQQSVNISHAGYIARELWKRGWACIVPHKNSAYFAGVLDNSELDQNIWLTGYLTILERCDAIYFLENFEKSKGSMLEYKRALEIGLPMYFESRKDLIG